MDGPESTITGIHCSPVENMLALSLVHCNHHSVCRLLDLDTLAVRNEIRCADNDVARSDCKVSPDGKLVVFQCTPSYLQVYHISPEPVLINQFAFFFHPGRILFDFTPDSRRLAVLYGSSIRFWDIYDHSENGSAFDEFHLDELIEAQKLLSIPQETSLAVLTRGGTIVQLGFGFRYQVIHSEARFLGISLSSSGRLLATRAADNNTDNNTDNFIEIWDPISKEDLPITRVRVNEYTGSPLRNWVEFASSPDGQQLAGNVVGASGTNCLGIWGVDL
jgi:hypothetical protein